jgi:hypothetical protein
MSRPFEERSRTYPAVDLNEAGQLALFHELKKFYVDLPFKNQPTAHLRFYFDNPWFSYGDATVLYCMMRHLRPKHIIEIGSGYSSAVMLDTNDQAFRGEVACTFIEPNPARLLDLLREGDLQRHKVIPKQLQDVGPDCFEALSPGDIVFVDSSHISAAGSDVNYIFFEILPHCNVASLFISTMFSPDLNTPGRGYSKDGLITRFTCFGPSCNIIAPFRCSSSTTSSGTSITTAYTVTCPSASRT